MWFIYTAYRINIYIYTWHNCRHGWRETSQEPLTGWQPPATTGLIRDRCVSRAERREWCCYDGGKARAGMLCISTHLHTRAASEIQLIAFPFYACCLLAYLSYSSISRSIIGWRKAVNNRGSGHSVSVHVSTVFMFVCEGFPGSSVLE